MKNGFVDPVGEGENGRNGESSINIYPLSCMKWIGGEKVLYNVGSTVWHSVVTYRGEVVGRGRRLRKEEIYV